MQSLLILAVFFVILYLFMIRPQQKQQQKRNEMLQALKKGDNILTIGGIQGEIHSLSDDRIVLKVAQGVNITMLRSAVGQVLEDGVEEPKQISENSSSDD